MRPGSILRATLGLASTLVLVGCGQSPRTRFLTLDVVAPSAEAVRADLVEPVRVDAVHIPPALDRPELVREFGDHELQVNDFYHWGAPLGELARRALTQDLLARLPADRVIFPDAPKPRDALGLHVDILAISEGGGATTMEVSWTLVPERSGTALSSVSHSIRLSAPGGGDAAAHAGVLSQLLAQLADRIVSDLPGQAPRIQAP